MKWVCQRDGREWVYSYPDEESEIVPIGRFSRNRVSDNEKVVVCCTIFDWGSWIFKNPMSN